MCARCLKCVNRLNCQALRSSPCVDLRVELSNNCSFFSLVVETLFIGILMKIQTRKLHLLASLCLKVCVACMRMTHKQCLDSVLFCRFNYIKTTSIQYKHLNCSKANCEKKLNQFFSKKNKIKNVKLDLFFFFKFFL